jgi:hypothetical protein
MPPRQGVALAGLAQDEEPTGREARGRGGLGQEPMALKRLTQAMATISTDRRRDIHISLPQLSSLS